MKNLLLKFTPYLLLIFLCSCLKVNYLIDNKSETTKNYQTYFIDVGENSIFSNASPKNIVYAKQVLIDELNNRNLQEVDSINKADLVIHVNVIMIEKKGADNYFDHYYSNWDALGYDAEYTEDYLYKEGALSIDCFDNQSKKVIYQGVAETEISDGHRLSKKQIKKIISSTLNNF